LITVVGSSKLYAVSYAVSTLSVVRMRLGLLRERLGSLRLSVPGFLVNVDFLTLLLVRLRLRGLSVASFLVNMNFFTMWLGSCLLRLSVASVLVDADLFTVLRGLGRKLLGKLLGRLLGKLLGRLLILRAVLRTTVALFFVDANLFLDVSVVVLFLGRRRRRLLDGCGEGFVDLFVTFPSV